ncbi:MAG: hypothetical protein CMI18_12995 [Opitutaceae bacterium]|nr:hypothetical protein [Opitutaceae bacterium]
MWIDRLRCLLKKNRSGIATILTIELLLAQLAIASPQLHDWLHGESVCSHHEESEASEEKDHVCFIQLLNEGVDKEVRSDNERPETVVASFPKSIHRFSSVSALARQCARGPPILFR